MVLKKSTLENYFENNSNLFLLLLFPGYALYSIIIAYNIIPPVLGSFYGIVSIIYLASMFPVILSINLFLKTTTKLYSFLLINFFIYLLFIAFLNYILYYSPEIGLAFLQVIEAIILIFTVFLLGFFIRFEKKLYIMLLFTILISLILILAYVFNTGEVIFNANQIADESVSESVSSYQGFARSAMVVSLITLSMTNVLSKYMGIYLLSVFVLFFLGARSELIGVIFAASLLIPLKFKISFPRLVQLAVFLLFIIFSIYLAYENFSTSRIFQLLAISDSSSWIARNELQQIAVGQIKEHPLFGYFGGHVIEGGSTGSYSHNLLSVWAGFGFIAFSIYILLCLIPVIDFSLLALKKKSYSNKFYLCLGFGLAVLLLIVTSKSLYWFMPGIVWGMYLSVKRDIYDK